MPKGVSVKDIVLRLQEVLFVIRNPHPRKQPFKSLPAWKTFLAATGRQIVFAHYPSENYAVRMLAEPLYFEVRTARNRNLITAEEQVAYRRSVVGIAGLSVGSSILAALAMTGGPRRIKIADFDTLDPSNLNRIRAGLADVGIRKIELAARDIWGLDPFADLKLYPKGLHEKKLSNFIIGSPTLDIFIDEMDDLGLKVAARLLARRHRIPVLMATDNGDGVMLDVERFDEEPRRKIFHGLVGNLTVAGAKRAKGPAWFGLVKKIIGERYMPKRHRESLREVGTTLAGVPQLGTDAWLGGAAVSLAVRKIASGQPLASGKYVIDLNGSLKKPLVS
jgi:molybdopterin/thiamine biosynthesis adenylyltransferase